MKRFLTVLKSGLYNLLPVCRSIVDLNTASPTCASLLERISMPYCREISQRKSTRLFTSLCRKSCTVFMVSLSQYSAIISFCASVSSSSGFMGKSCSLTQPIRAAYAFRLNVPAGISNISIWSKYAGYCNSNVFINCQLGMPFKASFLLPINISLASFKSVQLAPVKAYISMGIS